MKFPFFVFAFCFLFVGNLFSQITSYKDLVGIWEAKDSITKATISWKFNDSTHLVFMYKANFVGTNVVNCTYSLDTIPATTLLYVQEEDSKKTSYFLIKIVNKERLKIQGDSRNKPEKWDDIENFRNTMVLVKNMDNK